MMVLDHVGDQEAMVYAQLGHQPLVRTTATSLEPRRGTLSCLSARPPDLADVAITRPQVVSMFLSIVPFLYSKRTAAARSLVSRYGRLNVLWPFRVNHSLVDLPRGGEPARGRGGVCPSSSSVSQRRVHQSTRLELFHAITWAWAIPFADGPPPSLCARLWPPRCVGHPHVK